LIVSILSAGTFVGALCGGIIADWIGRRISIIIACGVFCIGVALQVSASVSAMLMSGRLVAGFGVGLVSSIVIMYMSEIAPKAIRGAIVAGYQWAITIVGFFSFAESIFHCVDFHCLGSAYCCLRQSGYSRAHGLLGLPYSH
jgi:MFS family permease